MLFDQIQKSLSRTFLIKTGKKSFNVVLDKFGDSNLFALLTLKMKVLGFIWSPLNHFAGSKSKKHEKVNVRNFWPTFCGHDQKYKI